MILHPRDRARHRHAVDVHVHRRQEDADLLPLPGGRARPRRLAGDHHRPSAGDSTRSAPVGGCAIGIAEEEQEERGEDAGTAPTRRGRTSSPTTTASDERADDERPARAIDPHLSDDTRVCRVRILVDGGSVIGHPVAGCPKTTAYADRPVGDVRGCAVLPQDLFHPVFELQLAFLEGDFFDLFGV